MKGKGFYEINFISKQHALQLTKKRKGEKRVGEVATYYKPEFSLDENLKKSDCTFVLVGIPEDVGVRANFGRSGAYSAWQPALENVLSIQSNCFFTGKELFVAGALDVDDLMKKAGEIDAKTPEGIASLRQITAELDERVAGLIHTIVKHGKIPVIIGGGHNNSFGNLK